MEERIPVISSLSWFIINSVSCAANWVGGSCVFSSPKCVCLSVSRSPLSLDVFSSSAQIRSCCPNSKFTQSVNQSVRTQECLESLKVHYSKNSWIWIQRRPQPGNPCICMWEGRIQIKMASQKVVIPYAQSSQQSSNSRCSAHRLFNLKQKG